MDAQSITDDLRQIIARVMNVPIDKIGENTSFLDDLEVDSLSLLEIQVDTEMHFDVKLAEEHVRGFRTVSDAARVVGEYLALASEK
jgi:acyl carrier protein